MKAAALICRWLKAVLGGGLPAVLRGNANRLLGRGSWLYRERMEVCSACAWRESAKGIGEYCADCGCPLKSKLRDPKSECGLGKWGKIASAVGDPGRKKDIEDA